ncbi:hypothetical protein CWO84_02870 [Methylomonas sp. Kb3]|uniref:hypothetical protein n=1 Tax=Methylomonas sp. Kb3 TaxID=1611544 RepID=UPI000C342211|nr:hypothetical protein [Methylomonas sp. Kb3]PKD41984.1 hypothetical protein CWO84_02870 [Methylomonas sp. Kb3]
MAQNQPKTPESVELTSDWGGLSPHLIASFYPVDRNGIRKKYNDKYVVVKAALVDPNMEASFSWQSPFEQAGPETKAPTLFAMLQSGAIQPIIDAIPLLGDGSTGNAAATRLLQQFEGRTGITKLNSVQVFNGMPPVKFTLTALFRAWKDPANEVERPFDQLMEWALPVELAKDSSLLVNAVEKVRGGDKDWIESVLPSQSPTLLAMSYKGRTYAPLVIESIGQPISSPIDKTGAFVELAVPLSLATLTAIDRQDWSRTSLNNVRSKQRR